MIVEYNGIKPKLGENSKVFDTAFVSGDVTLGKNVSVWPGASVRGDIRKIWIGDNTNIQDGAVLHTSIGSELKIGKNVTIGHGAILHGCTVGDDVTIGMGAIVLDGATVGNGATVGAGSLIPPGKAVEDNMLAVGNPYKVIRAITPEQAEYNSKNMLSYLETMKNYD